METPDMRISIFSSQPTHDCNIFGSALFLSAQVTAWSIVW